LDSAISREHVLVCISPSPSNKRIVDEAYGLARAFKAQFTALYIQGSGNDKLSEEDEKRLRDNIKYAEDKGADITNLIGSDISSQIAEFARISGVTKLVIGRSRDKKSFFRQKQSLTEQLIPLVPDIDIYIIPDLRAEIKKAGNISFVDHILPTGKDLWITACLLFFMTLLGLCFYRLGFTEANIITVYILGVLLDAIYTRSHMCSLISSLGSVLLFNYFFTEPRLTFHAYEAGYYVTFFVMLTAALLTGSLANKLKNSASESARTAYRTKVLFDTNQLLQKSRTMEEVLKVTSSQVNLLLDRDVIIFPVERDKLGSGYLYTKEKQGDRIDFSNDSEAEVIEWVFRNQKKAGATTKIFPKAGYLYLAIRINGTVYGIMGIKIENSALKSFENSILLSILGECALALENLNNEKQKEEAALIAENEKLRANLLRSISHDLRTPLTSISGNASNLMNHYEQIDDETRQQIFTDIYDDSSWLINLVENLLSVTRIENGQMKLNMSVELVSDVIDEALKHIDRNSCFHHIKVKGRSDMLFADMDAKLMIQVIINIVNNAIKYTNKGSLIEIEYGEEGSDIYVSISDNGPGMDDQTKAHAFDMFYTGKNATADSNRSMGLGLFLCKSVIEAHNGRIELKDNKPSGCIFTFYLAKKEVDLDEQIPDIDS
jgi:two-component system sensor histidine kinase KdpD